MKKCCVMILLLLLMPCMAFAQNDSNLMFIDGKEADRVHLRLGPEFSSASLGLYFTGTPVFPLSNFNSEWTHVQIGTETGYVYSGYLSLHPPARSSFPAFSIENSGSYVNLRQSPCPDSAILKKYPHGLTVSVLGETASGWSYVKLGEETGYISSGFLIPCAEDASGKTHIVGQTADGDLIHAYPAGNGQTLYFASTEEEPSIEMNDVNFDGRDDLVIHISMGASNRYSEFFVFDGVSYQRVKHEGSSYGFSNYALYPDENIIVSYAANGYAGALHEYLIYRWEGKELNLLRRASSELLRETVSSNNTSYAQITYTERIRLCILDYTSGESGGTVLLDAVLTLDEIYEAKHGKEQELLWQGL